MTSFYYPYALVSYLVRKSYKRMALQITIASNKISLGYATKYYCGR